MTARVVWAIVLAVFTAILLVIGTAIQRRRFRHTKVRARDLVPPHIQQNRLMLASLRRVYRGLRFPTVQEKKRHQRFLKALKSGDINAIRKAANA